MKLSGFVLLFCFAFSLSNFSTEEYLGVCMRVRMCFCTRVCAFVCVCVCGGFYHMVEQFFHDGEVQPGVVYEISSRAGGNHQRASL